MKDIFAAGIARHLGRLAVLLIAFPWYCHVAHAELYLHDDKLQAVSEKVKSDFTSANPLGVFDDQTKFFSTLTADEQNMVKASVQTRRDRDLILLMEGSNTSRKGRLWKAIQRLLGPRTDGTAGTGGNEDFLGPLRALQYSMSNARDQIEKGKLNLNLDQASYKRDTGKDAPGCDKVTSDTSDALNRVRNSCKAIKDWEDLLAGLTAKLKPFSGALPASLLALEADRNQLTKDTQQAAAVKKAIADAKKILADNAARNEDKTFARRLLKLCAADPESAAGSDAAVKDPVTVPTSAPKELQDAYTACTDAAAKALTSVMKVVKHESVLEEIHEALTKTLDGSAAGSGSSKLESSTVAVLEVLQTFAKIGDDAAASKQPSANALLVAAAFEQYQVAKAQADVDNAKKKLQISQDAVEALVAEASHLVRAYDAVTREIAAAPKPAANAKQAPTTASSFSANESRMLVEANLAWSVGRYRAELAEYANVALLRDSALASSKQSTSAWINVLKPAMDELAAYGKGGVSTEAIAGFVNALVNALGFSAVAKKL